MLTYLSSNTTLVHDRSSSNDPGNSAGKSNENGYLYVPGANSKESKKEIK